MKSKDKGVSGKTSKSPIAIILYIAAAVVALVGIALLIDNIYIYKTTIDQYIAQGYPAAEVKKSIIPSQLLPGIFDPIAVYGGVALILLGVGMANKKLSKLLAIRTGAEDDKEPDEGSAVAGQTESAVEQTAEKNEAESEGLEFVEPADKDLP